jgi:mannose-6-phosphate isomerase
MILLMNLVELKAGDAVYQPQGLIHAYLEGRNVEIMANSDNVLRAGLTSKHIDAEDLVKISNLESTNPNDFIVRVERDENGIRSFDTPYEDFLLRDIEIPANGTRELRWEKAQVLVFFSGEALEVGADGTSFTLCQGESAFCRPGTSVTLTNKSQRTAHLFIGSGSA